MSILAPLIQSYQRIAPGDRRALLLMFLFLVLVGGYLFLLEPLVLRYQAAQRGLEELADRQRGYHQQVRVLPQREARWLEHGAELQALERHFELATSDPQGAVARVIPELIDYARLCQVEVSGLRPLDPSIAGNYLELPLEAEIEGDYQGLHRFIYFVDTSPSILAVTDLDLRPQGRGRLRARIKVSHVVRRPPEQDDSPVVEPADNTQRLRIGTDYGAGSAPLAVAERNGYLQQDEFRIRPLRLDDAATATRMLQSGALDALIASLPELLELHAKGPPLRLVLPLSLLHGGHALVINAAAEMRDIGDLRGERIGVEGQGPLSYVLYLLMKEQGLEHHDARVQIQRRRMVERELLAGTLQAGMLAEPALSRLEQADRVRVLAASKDLKAPIPVYLAVTQKAVETKGPVLQLAVSALHRALAFLAEQPDQGIRLTADWSGQTVDAIRTALAGIEFSTQERLQGSLSGGFPDPLLDPYAGYFAATGRPFPAEEGRGMIETRFLEQALRQVAVPQGGDGHGG